MHPIHQPLSFGEVLDSAFSLYRRNFATFAATVLVPGAVVAAANVLWIGPLLDAGRSKDLGTMGAALMDGGAVLLLLSAVLAAVTWCALTHQVAQVYSGEPTSLVGGLRAARGSALPLLGAWLIGMVCVGVPLLVGGWFVARTAIVMMDAGPVLMLLIVPVLTLAYLAACLALLALFFAVAPAVVCEGMGSAAAVVRSVQLARGALLRVMALVAVLLVMDALIRRGMAALIFRGTQPGVEPSTLTMIAQQLLALSIQGFTVPFTVGVLMVAYYDRRVRTEALDVQMMTDFLAIAGD
jgi:hypothetical protein